MGIPVHTAGPAAHSSAAVPMPPLREACAVFKQELGVGGANLAEVVEAACEALGISDANGLSLVQKAERCWTSLKG